MAKYRTVKITVESYEVLHGLMDKVSRNGWASIGANRNDKLIIANVIDEAFKALHERKVSKK
jgi:hypothetical protein